MPSPLSLPAPSHAMLFAFLSSSSQPSPQGRRQPGAPSRCAPGKPRSGAQGPHGGAAQPRCRPAPTVPPPFHLVTPLSHVRAQHLDAVACRLPSSTLALSTCALVHSLGPCVHQTVLHPHPICVSQTQNAMCTYESVPPSQVQTLPLF
ncbi:hypothetical protein SETIT_1G159100v2 [Setaria italica]|uniref:Uncharacterized protein n=2 Tax=Setaria TaxID=4554 RepID=A0A368PLM1_SETIT|nr:hypothetical protein SETIT_1G159100v2 [Setaria italica]